jgi:hypothetical protein
VATAKKALHEKEEGIARKVLGAGRSKSGEGPEVATIDRRGFGDRRANGDRRKGSVPVAVDRRKLARRVKVNRRRQIDPTTCERDYSIEEIEFMSAMDEYKRRSGRMFPTCSEVLEVLRGLGYEKRSTDATPPCQPATDISSVPSQQA